LEEPSTDPVIADGVWIPPSGSTVVLAGLAEGDACGFIPEGFGPPAPAKYGVKLFSGKGTPHTLHAGDASDWRIHDSDWPIGIVGYVRTRGSGSGGFPCCISWSSMISAAISSFVHSDTGRE